jgi:hypothetical protein
MRAGSMQASFELVDQIFVPFQLKMKLKPTNFGINRQYQINENPVTSLSSLELKQFHDIDNNLKRKLITYFFFHSTTAPSRPGPPHCRSFTIALGHTTLDKTPLDE